MLQPDAVTPTCIFHVAQYESALQSAASTLSYEIPKTTLTCGGMDLRKFSIEQLIRISIQYGIVTDYTMSPDSVRLFHRDEMILSANPEEARFFLQGLIRGYTSSLANRIGDTGAE